MFTDHSIRCGPSLLRGQSNTHNKHVFIRFFLQIQRYWPPTRWPLFLYSKRCENNVCCRQLVYDRVLYNCYCGVNDIIIITIIIIVIQLFYLRLRLFHLGQFHRGGRRSSYAKSSMLHAHNKTLTSDVQRVPSVVLINLPSMQAMYIIMHKIWYNVKK